jgi:transporter family protein
MKEVRDLSKNNILFLALSGIATGLSWIFYFKALETGDVSKVAPIDKLSVVFAMLFAFIFLKEQADPKVIAGGLLIAIGAIVIIW